MAVINHDHRGSGSVQLEADRIEALIFVGFAIGASLLVTHRTLGKSASEAGGRLAKVCVEFQRKSFHMIGGCLICSFYHWGLKRGFLAPAFKPCEAVVLPEPAATGGAPPMDASVCFLGACLVCWMVEASRLMVPAVQRWYLDSFKGLIREKELKKAAGIAYFLPGSLAAVLAAPSDVAILSILFLSIGDAAASIGTAAGSMPVGSSSRKVEGSIGCFTVCTLLGFGAGLPLSVAATAAGLVTFGELLAEVIGVDDNCVIPMLGVLGVRLGLSVQIWQLASIMGGTLVAGILLGLAVGSTTPRAAAGGGGGAAAAPQARPQKANITAVSRTD